MAAAGAKLSHRNGTVGGVWRLGVLAGQFVVQLPVLAVLITSFVLVSSRRGRIGARRAGLARAGLGLLALDAVLSMLWPVALQSLITGRGIEYTRIGIVSGIVGFLLTALVAAGIALLVAAVLAPGQPAGNGFAEGAYPGVGGYQPPPGGPRADAAAGHPGGYGPGAYAGSRPGYGQEQGQPGYGQDRPGYGQDQNGYGQNRPAFDQGGSGHGQRQGQPNYSQGQPGQGQGQPSYGQGHRSPGDPGSGPPPDGSGF